MDSEKRAKQDETIELWLGDDLHAKVSVFGATVVSFTIKGREVLFVSEKAIFDSIKPIRGGIPLVFPQFGAGNGELPSHGFARTSRWKLIFESAHKVILSLNWQDDLSSKAWKHAFYLEYTVELSKESGGSLVTSMRILNAGLVGEEPFEFQCLQHTYLAIPDVSKVSVSGLGKGASFINQLAKGEIQKLDAEALGVGQEVDWIFLGNPDKEHQDVVVGLGDGTSVSVKRSLAVASKKVACDVVVWNPWVEKSKKMADFGDDEYRTMICVEPGNVSRKDILRGGEDAVLTQVLSLVQ
jgi:glucose-6-phosphate 1-epimerase